MYNIVDYLMYYKDISIDDVRWNYADNLLCAMLSYLPLDSFKGGVKLDKLYKMAESFKERDKNNPMAPESYKLLDIIKNSKRYEGLKVYNFVSYKNNEAQFGAVTFRIKGETVISFMGTDYSLIGWFENFRLSYEYPTRTQALAISYLKENVRLFENKNLYVCGHSKGGNLALVSAMESPKHINSRIKKVYNFDGPGLRREEFLSEKYKRISERLVNIVPDGSVVGVLLDNENFEVIKSESVAINKHNPMNWNMFGEFFVPSKLSSVSKQLHESSTNGLLKVSREERKKAFEAIFKSFEGEHSRDFQVSLTGIIKVYKNMKNIEPEAKKSIDAIVDAILKVQLFNKNKE